MTYQLTDSDSILRLEDNALIPADNSNGDYIIYLQWLEEGSEPKPNPGVKPYTWEQAIVKRDEALTASDWTMIPGCTVDQHAWAVYRQILRDIPQTFANCDPIGIIWPEKPSTDGPNTKPKDEDPAPVETPADVVEAHAAEVVATENVVTLEEVVPAPSPAFVEPEVSPEPAEATIDTTEVK